MGEMSFRETLIAFFKAHGIRDPVAYLARRGGVKPDSVYVYLRQAQEGVGRGAALLDPKVAAWFIWESNRVLRDVEHNPVREFLELRLETFYAASVEATRQTQSQDERSQDGEGT